MRIEIKYGVAIALLTGLWLYLEYFAGLHTRYIHIHPYVTNFALLIPIIGITLALCKVRAERFHGSIRYGQGVKSGAVVSGIAALVSIATQGFYHAVINPGWTEFMVGRVRERAMEQGKDEAAIQNMVERAEMSFSPGMYIFQSAVFALIFGLVITLVAMIFLKNKN